MFSEATLTWSSPIRWSRCSHDSVNPCLAWARSPTIVKLRDGQRMQQHLPLSVGQLLGLVHHDVGERPGEQVGVGLGQSTLVDEGVADAVLPELGHHALVVVGLEDLVDDPVHALAFGGDGRLVTTPAARGLGIAQTLPSGVKKWQVGGGPGPGVVAPEQPTSSGLSHGAHRRR